MNVRIFLDVPDVQVTALELNAGNAVLLRGASAHWPAKRKYSFSYFAGKCGDIPVPLRGGRFGYRPFGVTALRNFLDALAGISKFIGGSPDIHDAVQAHPASNYIHLYMTYCFLANDYPDLLHDVNLAEFLAPNTRVEPPSWWIGDAGCETPFHYDIESNVFAQIVGEKTFELAPYRKDVNKIMRPAEFFEPGSTYSSVDFSMIPNYGAMIPDYHIVKLNPGDVLLLPPRMWHQVKTQVASISVQSFFNERFAVFQKLRLWRLECQKILHAAGFYRVGKCACHSIDAQAQFTSAESWLFRKAAQFGQLKSHGQELADIAGWSKITQ